jgi:hypothetical protein
MNKTLLAATLLLTTGCQTIASADIRFVSFLGAEAPEKLCELDQNAPFVKRELKLQGVTCRENAPASVATDATR